MHTKPDSVSEKLQATIRWAGFNQAKIAVDIMSAREGKLIKSVKEIQALTNKQSVYSALLLSL